MTAPDPTPTPDPAELAELPTDAGAPAPATVQLDPNRLGMKWQQKLLEKVNALYELEGRLTVQEAVGEQLMDERAGLLQRIADLTGELEAVTAELDALREWAATATAPVIAEATDDPAGETGVDAVPDELPEELPDEGPAKPKRGRST